MEARLRRGRDFLRLGESPAALVELSQAYELAVAAGDALSQRSALKGRAQAYRKLGDFDGALSELFRAVAINLEQEG